MMEEAEVDFILTEEAYAHQLDGFPLRLIELGRGGLNPPPRPKPPFNPARSRPPMCSILPPARRAGRRRGA